MPAGRQVKPLFKGSEIQLTADSGFQVTLQPHLLLLNLHSGPAYFYNLPFSRALWSDLHNGLRTAPILPDSWFALVGTSHEVSFWVNPILVPTSLTWASFLLYVVVVIESTVTRKNIHLGCFKPVMRAYLILSSDCVSARKTPRAWPLLGLCAQGVPSVKLSLTFYLLRDELLFFELLSECLCWYGELSAPGYSYARLSPFSLTTHLSSIYCKLILCQVWS